MACRYKDIGNINVRMSRGLDKEQTAMDTGILDIPLALSSKLLPEIGGVLILDILDNWVPAVEISISKQFASVFTHFTYREPRFRIPSIIVNLVTIAGGIDNVQAQTDAVLFDDCRDER